MYYMCTYTYTFGLYVHATHTHVHTVKVSMSHCPSSELPGPEWYQIDIFTNSSAGDGAVELGELYALKNDVLLCNQRTVSHALVCVVIPQWGSTKFTLW